MDLISARTLCRPSNLDDAPEVLAFFEANREHLDPWEPARSPEFFTERYIAETLLEAEAGWKLGKAFRFHVYLRESMQLIGIIHYSSAERGVFQNCRLGYRLGKKWEGQGLMFEAIEVTLEYIFEALNFHRVEANFMTSNKRSRALLERLGFLTHGTAKKYLCINGKWEDHVLASLINDEWVAHS